MNETATQLEITDTALPASSSIRNRCSGFSHAELVERSCRWLRNSARINAPWTGHEWGERKLNCRVVVSEMTCGHIEIPDAIGWADSSKTSILIECKASRADFLRDKKKMFRQRPKFGFGKFRYYFANPGIIKVNELPKRWGLLEMKNKRIVEVLHLASSQEYQRTCEMDLLWSALRRLQN